MKNNSERLSDILSWLDSISYIKTEKIPEVDLYMDQVTSFMEEHLKKTKRSPEDKALTKTMINNYAKNRLLPAPVRKKYSKEHILLLLFIYYYKNLLSINDIEQLFRPVTEQHFRAEEGLSLSDIYEEVFSREDLQMEHLKDDVRSKFEDSLKTFADSESDDKEYLQLFSFISELSFDVYLKKHMIEMLIDQLREEMPLDPKTRKTKK
ncbi:MULTISPECIES: DUF1836 domain-containing protein [unclassified Clostridium]|uniref:DUF1836 domain-containing protein n=1 Tax=unclassified Clostridium TaxID=2614128 RepID=UPI000E4C7ABB|nr:MULTISPECIES: DUF1836 domain-containing protein [unclassified Clostridium]RHP42719.1 DUF1836 domain-containing protein [Clostridium sp. AF32-12BH]RHV69779.1 DUF1836 domain-containing protein [Clostridium sp. OM02-18AC]